MQKKQHFCLQPAKFKLDGGAMFGIIPKPLWNKVHPSDEYNRIDLALRLQLIKTDDRIIIIDTGIGDYHPDKFNQQFDIRSPKGPLNQALQLIGLNCDDVTDIIISHMHFDHIGGLGHLAEGSMEPVFKNATLHLHKKHYEYALSPSQKDAGSFHTKYFSPLIEYYSKNNKISWQEEMEGTLIKLDEGDINFKCSHGHTPWLMHPYDENYIYLSDLIPTSNHVHIPWVMAYDIEPVITTKFKKEFLDFMIKNNLKGIFEHDPKLWGASISKNEKGKYTIERPLESKDEEVFRIS